jgi:hypothetical protein
MAEFGNLISAGIQDIKLAGEALGLYETDLKKAHRRRFQLEQIAPLIDEMDSLLTQRASERPNLWQKRFDRWQNIKSLYQQAYDKQVGVMEGERPEIRIEEPDEELLRPVPTQRGELLQVYDQYTTQREPEVPRAEVLPSTTAVAPTEAPTEDPRFAPPGQLLQAEMPGVLDSMAKIGGTFKEASRQGIVNAMSALAQLPRVAGNLGMLAPFTQLSLERRLELSQEIGSEISDRIIKEVETYRPRTDLKPIESFSELKDPERIAQGIAENAPLMATLMFSYIMNPVAGTALMFGVEGGDAAQMMDQMEDELGIKVSPENKALTTLAVGGINAALERVGIDQITQGILRPYKSRIVMAMLGAGAEGGTEFIQEWTQILAEAGVKDDPKLEDPTNISKKFDLFWQELGKKENWIQSLHAGEIGAFFGIGAAGGAGAAQAAAVERGEEAEFEAQREEIAEQQIAKERKGIQREARNYWLCDHRIRRTVQTI